MANLLRVLGASLIITLVVVFWGLSRGPLSLSALVPYIEDTLKHKSNFEIQIRDISVEWAGWQKPLTILVKNMKFRQLNNSLVGEIPETVMSLDKKVMLKGKIEPNYIKFSQPNLIIRIREKGKFPKVEIIQLLSNLGEYTNLQNIKKIEIDQVKVGIHDEVLKKSILTAKSNISLTRNGNLILGRMFLFLRNDEKPSELELQANYEIGSKHINLVADFSQIKVASIASFIHEKTPIQLFDVPFSGNVTLTIPLDDSLHSINFDLVGGEGVVTLPIALPKPIKVKKVKLTGSYHTETKITKINNMKIDFPQDFQFSLNSLVGNALPLSSVAMTANYDGTYGFLDIFSLRANLQQGSSVAVKGVLSGFMDQFPINANITVGIANCDLKNLREYWPKDLKTQVRQLVVSHFSDGMIDRLEFETIFNIGKEKEFNFSLLDGKATISRSKFDYLSDMPTIYGIGAEFRFDLNGVFVKINSGQSQGLNLEGSKIKIHRSIKEGQIADFKLRINGGLREQIKYFTNGFTKANTSPYFDSKNIRGEAETELNFLLPIKKKYKLGNIQFSGNSKIKNVIFSNFLNEYEIKGKEANLKIDNHGLILNGELEIDSLPTTLNWVENFSSKSKFLRRYDLSISVDNINSLEDYQWFSDYGFGKYIHGSLKIGVQFQESHEASQETQINIDMANAKVSLPEVGWNKPLGREGWAKFLLNKKRGENFKSSEFFIRAGDLSADGRILFLAKDSRFKSVNFNKLKFGRTNIKGKIASKDGEGWQVNITGQNFDVSELWEDFLEKSPKESGSNLDLPNLSIVLELDKVWLGKEDALLEVSSSLEYKDKIWDYVRLDGKLDKNTNLQLDIRPKKFGGRSLVVRSNNAGEFFRFFKFYENMLGGILNIKGDYDDTIRGEPLSGKVNVKGFRVENAPILTHLLSILALTGILEALEGGGLAFQEMEMPFRMHNGVLTLKEARASGPSLGFTASGKINNHTKTVDLEGTMIPAYALNSVFGYIPLVGSLLTGGEKGGGVFAANYNLKGAMDDPKILVNPLSALTPGFLRKVFGIFESRTQKQE